MTQPTNLGDLIDRRRDLDRPALIDLRSPEAPRPYTHREVDRLAGGVARYLQAQGLESGTRVAIAALNRAEYLAAYFGIMRAGLVAVPINIKLPRDTVDFIVGDAQVRLAFVDAPRRGLFGAAIPVLDFDDAGPEGFAQRIVPGDFDTVRPVPGAVAQVLYTSGSTGRPKGVPLSHAGQLWALQARGFAPEAENERQIVAQPLFHMNGLMVSKGVFITGASLVLQPAFDAAAYTDALARWRVTSVMAIPTMFARVVKELERRPALDLSALKRIGLGSAPLTLALVERIRAAIPSAVVVNGYGTTEAGPAVFGPHPGGLPTPPLALGVPVAGGEIKLVDGLDEDADEGVLWMRNPAVTHGYLNLPDKNTEVLKDGWYVSGDVFRRDAQGFYTFVGRADDMFVCSGENIYPGEVEKLLEQHPQVQHAAVVPLPDEERSAVPVAFVVRSAGAQITVDEIKQFAIARGPAYQHPRRVAFVPELPWAGTNKIDRAALLRLSRELEAAHGWAQ
jgi:acyl-CoA synthetase (AMP-forming)/AMP-acid ligase II